MKKTSMLAQFAPQQEDNERKRRTKYAEVERTGVSTPRWVKEGWSVCFERMCGLGRTVAFPEWSSYRSTKFNNYTQEIHGHQFLYVLVDNTQGGWSSGSLGTSERDLRSFPDLGGTEKNEPPHPELFYICILYIYYMFCFGSSLLGSRIRTPPFALALRVFEHIILDEERGTFF